VYKNLSECLLLRVAVVVVVVVVVVQTRVEEGRFGLRNFRDLIRTDHLGVKANRL